MTYFQIIMRTNFFSRNGNDAFYNFHIFFTSERCDIISACNKVVSFKSNILEKKERQSESAGWSM